MADAIEAMRLAADKITELRTRIAQLEQQNLELVRVNRMFQYPPEHRVSILEAENQRLRADLDRASDDRHRLVNAIFANVDRETYGAIMRAENPSSIDAARSGK